MKNSKPKNSQCAIAIIATATGCSIAMLSGCAPREEAAAPVVVNKTTIEKAPEKKTIVVQPPAAPKPAPKTETRTNVKVEVQPTPKPAPEKTQAETKLPPPAPASTPKAKPAPKADASSASPPKIAARPGAKPPKKPDVEPAASKPTGDKLKVRAEVVATSKMPDPKSVPYKDSLIFTKYKILEVENGKYNQKEILVAQWGMKNKKLQPAARRKVGDVQTLALEPLAKHPELESVMRSDDTDAYDLEPYLAE